MLPGSIATGLLGSGGLNFGKESKWFVTHVEDSSGLFYLQQTDISVSVKYERLNQEIEGAIGAGKLQPYDSCPNIGGLCLAQYSEDELWYRGQILSLDECDNAEVIFIDFGNGETLSWKSLLVIPKEFTELPAQAIQCRLANIEPVGGIWSKEAVKLLKDMILDRELVGIPAHLCKTGAVVMKLFADADQSVMVAQQLVMAGFAHWKKVKSSASHSSSSTSNSSSNALSINARPGNLGQFKAKTGSYLDLCISYIESLDNFFCQPVQHSSGLKTMIEEMQSFYNSKQAQSLKMTNLNVDQICCAKFSEDGTWYRSIVKQVCADDKYEVLFLDFGNTEVLPVSEVRELNSRFHQLPIVGLPASLYGIKPANQGSVFDDAVIQKFEDLTHEKQLVGLVNRVEDSGKLALVLFDTTDSKDGLNINKELASSNKVSCDKDLEASPMKCDSSQSAATVQQHYVAITLETGDSNVGYVAYATSPFDFYCQIAKNLTSLDNMMHELNSEYSTLKVGEKALQLLQPGTPCCARYSEDGRFYRAELTSVKGTNAKIHFVDYGNDEQCRPDELKHLKKEFLKLPKQAFKCKISGIETPANGSFSVDVCKQFNDMVIDKEFNITVNGVDSPGIIEVSLIENNERNIVKFDAAKILIESGLVSPAKAGLQARDLGSVVSKEQFAEIQVPNDDYVDVMPTCAVSPSQFCCQLFEKYDEINEMMAELEETYKDSKPTTGLKNGMPCVALYPVDSVWYRAILQHIMGHQAEVIYVDYGNEEKIPLDNIRPIFSKFMTLPAQAFVCSLSDIKPKGSDEWSKASNDEFSNLVVEQQLIACIKRKEKSNLHHVELIDTMSNPKQHINIADVLVEKGFAEELKGGESQARNAAVQKQSGSSSGASASQIPMIKVSNEDDVEITFVNSPSSFYCQQTSVAGNVDKLLGELEAAYLNSGPSDFKMMSPQPGRLCAVKYSEDGAWYRGKILDIVDQSKAFVQYIDYGNCEFVALAELKELKEDFKKEPAFGLECVVAGVSSKSGIWEKQNIDKFKSMIEYKVFHAKFVTKQPPYQVTLVEDGKNIVDAIVSQGIAVTSSAAKESRGYSNIDLKVGAVEDVYVAHIDDLKNVYCQLTRTENSLYALMDQLATKSDGFANVSSLVQNKPICAIFSEDNGWYRGQIIKVVDSKSATVRFVDYGNCEDVSKAAMKEISAELLKEPKFAVLCTLDDGQSNWKENAVELLHQMTAEKVTKMTVKEHKDGKYLVDLNDETNASVISKLVAINKSPPGQQSKPSTNQQGARYPPATPETGVETNFYITHVDSFSDIYIQCSAKIEALDDLMLKLEEIPRQNGSFRKAETGLACIAEFSEDMAPYRAIVEKCNGQDVLVRFVDYGNTEEKSINDLCPLPDDLITTPPFSIKCSLKGVKQSASVKDVEKFKDLVFDKILQGKLEPLNSGLYQLTLFDKTITGQFCSIADEPKKTLENISISSGSSLDCYISHTESLKEFYAQPCKFMSDLDRVTNQMANAANYASLDQPAKGDVCCAKFPEDGLWYRAEITDNAGPKIKVLFVDFGNSSEVERKDIRSIPAVMLGIPRLAVPCSFSSVTTQSDEDMERFSTSTFDQIVSVQFQGKDVQRRNEVRLYLNGKELEFSKQSKSQTLHAETRNAAAGGSYSSAQSPAVIVEFNETSLNPGAEEKVFVCYVVTAQEFYCHLSKDADKLNDLMEKLEKHFAAMSPETGSLQSFVPGVPCAAKFEADGCWYRAAFQGLVSQTHAKITFVDYGNVESVPLADLKELGSELQEAPAFAVKCSLQADVGPGADFESRVMDQELSMKVVLKNGNTHFVDLVHDGQSIGKELSKQNAPAASATENTTGYKEVQMETGCENDAYFLYATSPSDFFIQLVRYEQAFENVMNDIAERAAVLQLLEVKMKGAPCIGLFSEDGGWYRGEILETKQGEARVLFVDYGNEEWVKNGNIKKIPNDLLELPRQALQCSLANATSADDTWSQQEIQSFKESCADKMFSVSVDSCKDGRFHVVLKDPQTSKTINGLFCKEKGPDPESKVKGNIATAASYEDVKVSKGMKFEALGTFVKATGEVSCQLLKFQDKLGEVMDDIALYCDGASKVLSQPVVGMPCLALFHEDDSWYRGKIIKLDGSVTVHFVDYGNDAVVEIDGIREARPKDLDLPITALDCKIPGIPINSDVIAFLEELCVNQELVVEVKDAEMGAAVVADVCKFDTGESICNMVNKKFSNLSLVANSKGNAEKAVRNGKKEFSKMKLDVNATENVLCSSVTAVDEVVAHILKHSQKFDEMMDKIAEHCGSTEELVTNPYVGQCCLGKYPVDGGWYRAVVLSTSSDLLKLRYVDYGNEDEVSFPDVREITEEFMQLPALGISCKLHDVHKDDLDAVAGKQWLEDSCFNNEYMIKVISNSDGNEDGVEVNMYYPETDETVNDELYSRFALEEPTAAVEPVKPLPTTVEEKPSSANSSVLDEKIPAVESVSQRFGDLELDSSERIEAFCCYVDDSLQVHFQPFELQTKLEELMVHVADYCAEETANTDSIEAGMACFAQFADDNEWYRAEIVKLMEDRFEVHFVDYGNSSMVNANQILPITKPFLTLPKASFACALAGTTHLKNGNMLTKSWLEEHFLEKTVGVEIKEKLESGVFVAKLFVDGQDVDELIKPEVVTGTVTVECSNDEAKSNESKMEEKISAEAFIATQIAANSTESVICCHVDSLQQVYLQLTKYQTEFDVLSERMQVYCNDECQTPAEPKLNSSCLARFTEDEIWYRAEITDVLDEKVQVQFVDFGNTDIVPFASTRTAVNEFTTLPVTSIKCKLHDVHNEDLDVNAAVQWLHETVVEQVLNVQVVDVVDGIHDCILSKPEAEGTVNDELYALFALAEEEHLLEDAGVLTKEENEERSNEVEAQSNEPEAQSNEPEAQSNEPKSQSNETETQSNETETQSNETETQSNETETQSNEPKAQSNKPEAQSNETETQSNETETQSNEPKAQSNEPEAQSNEPKALSKETETANKDVVIETFRQPSLELGAKENVICIHAVSIHDVCCQFTKFHAELDSISEKIAAYCESSQNIPESMEVGYACLAQFSEDSFWYRAEITNVLEDSVEVHFVDYGNNDKVHKSNVRVITSEFTSLPVTSVTCQLHDVHENDINVGKAVEWLHGNVVDHELVIEIIGKVDDVYDCFLRKVGEELSINDLLYEKFDIQIDEEVDGTGQEAHVDDGEEIPSAPNETPVPGDLTQVATEGTSSCVTSTSKVLLKSVRSREVAIGDTFFMHLSNPVSTSNFWCQFDDKASELIQLMTDIRSYYSQDDLPGFACVPSIGTFCCAQFSEDMEWCRGEVVAASDEDSCMIHFIDYGNIEKVHLAMIKELQPEFLSLEKQSVKCSLYNVEPVGGDWSDEATAEFSDICAEEIMKVEIVHKETDMLNVIINVNGRDSTVNQIMIYKGYGSSDVNKTNGFS